MTEERRLVTVLFADVVGSTSHPVGARRLDELVDYMEGRRILLVSSQARRLRGLLRSDDEDLAIALTAFEEMGAQPFIGRARVELGTLRRDAGLVAAGLAELEAVGDVARLAADARSARDAGLGG